MTNELNIGLIRQLLDGGAPELPDARAVHAWRVLRWETDVPLAEEQTVPLTVAITEILARLGPCAVSFSEDRDAATILLAHTAFPAPVHRATALWLCERMLAEKALTELELEGTLRIGAEFDDPMTWKAHAAPLQDVSEWWSQHSTMDGPTAHKHRAALQTLVKRRQYQSMAGYAARALHTEAEPGQAACVFVVLALEAIWRQLPELSVASLTEQLSLDEITRRPREALLAWLTHLVPMLRACPTTSDAPIERVLTAIRTDCSLPYTQANLSRSLGLTPAYFCRLFRETTGQHFSAFLTQTRMAQACQLLAEGKLSLQEISDRCGYPNKSYFCQVFKKYAGMTPGEYEQQCLVARKE